MSGKIWLTSFSLLKTRSTHFIELGELCFRPQQLAVALSILALLLLVLRLLFQSMLTLVLSSWVLRFCSSNCRQLLLNSDLRSFSTAFHCRNWFLSCFVCTKIPLGYPFSDLEMLLSFFTFFSFQLNSIYSSMDFKILNLGLGDSLYSSCTVLFFLEFLYILDAFLL